MTEQEKAEQQKKELYYQRGRIMGQKFKFTKSLADCWFCDFKAQCSEKYPLWSSVRVRDCHNIQKQSVSQDKSVEEVKS